MDIEHNDTTWHHKVTLRILVCITADVLHAQAPCMYTYNVQIYHTSLVFVSECNTQSHTAVWFPASPGGSPATAGQSFLMVF